MRMPMTWRSCEIAKLPSGAPVVVLHGALKQWFEARGLQAQISLSDESDYAVSFCIIESRPVAQAALPAQGDDAAEAAGALRPAAT
jgi:phosphopantetheinyl transferase (holo-ACP synthase)